MGCPLFYPTCSISRSFFATSFIVAAADSLSSNVEYSWWECFGWGSRLGAGEWSQWCWVIRSSKKHLGKSPSWSLWSLGLLWVVMDDGLFPIWSCYDYNLQRWFADIVPMVSRLKRNCRCVSQWSPGLRTGSRPTRSTPRELFPMSVAKAPSRCDDWPGGSTWSQTSPAG